MAPGRRGPSRAAWWLLTLLAPLILLGAGWSRRWVCDDAFIDFRVVQNLLEGHGPVFNPGERVEACSNPLWVGLLAAGSALLKPVTSGRLITPWVAVFLGLGLAVLALLLAQLGARRAALEPDERRCWLPLGALVVAALPPFWDFATSGLETGLTLAWLAGCYLGLASSHLTREEPAGEPLQAKTRTGRAGRLRRRLRPCGLPLLIGLGPLVRPDLGLFTLSWLWPLLHLTKESRRKQVAVAALTLLPAAVCELFRMGYFAALVPNPALAKEASLAWWERGLRYALDLGGTYWLAVPLLLVLLLHGLALAAARGRRGLFALRAATLLGALLHAGYITRMGGDFMHARLLLPSLFAFLLPASVIPLGRPREKATVLLCGAWCLICAAAFRPGLVSARDEGIYDERAYYVRLSSREHPVTLEDYRSTQLADDGRGLARLATRSRAVVLGERSPLLPPLAGHGLELLPRAADGGAPLVAGRRYIGILAASAGPAVHIVDRHGIADPVAARLRLPRRRRPGHEKYLTDDWVVARFAAAAAPVPRRRPPSPPLSPEGVAAARAALACGDLAELLAAIRERLTAGRFVRNLGLAWRLHGLRISMMPEVARRELCDGKAR